MILKYKLDSCQTDIASFSSILITLEFFIVFLNFPNYYLHFFVLKIMELIFHGELFNIIGNVILMKHYKSYARFNTN